MTDLRVGAAYAEALGAGAASLRATAAYVEVIGNAEAAINTGLVFIEVLASTGPAPPPALPPGVSAPQNVQKIIAIEFDLFDGSQTQVLRLANAGPAVRLQ